LEQTKKINQLKYYLDERLRQSLFMYRRAREPYYFNIKSQVRLVEE